MYWKCSLFLPTAKDKQRMSKNSPLSLKSALVYLCVVVAGRSAPPDAPVWSSAGPPRRLEPLLLWRHHPVAAVRRPLYVYFSDVSQCCVTSLSVKGMLYPQRAVYVIRSMILLREKRTRDQKSRSTLQFCLDRSRPHILSTENSTVQLVLIRVCVCVCVGGGSGLKQ